MRNVNRLKHDESGAVLVWVALLMVTLLGFGALAVDAGYGYVVKRETSTTADAASLAGAQAAAQQFTTDGWACTGAVTSEAKKAVDQTVTSNTVSGSNVKATTTVDCKPGARTIDVNVTVTTEIPTFFGAVLGKDKMQPGATATAQVSGNNGGGGLRPIGICAGDFPDHTVGAVWQSDFPQAPKKDSACGGAPGNFGVIRFISTAKNSDVEWYMKNGYPGPGDPILTIPGWLPADTGNGVVNGTEDEAFTLVNQSGNPANDIIIGMPVFDVWRGSGSGAEAHVTGIVHAKVCAYTAGSGTGVHDPSCFDPVRWAKRDTKAKNTFQWKFVEFIPAYSYGAAADCKIGPNCVPVVRLVK